MFKLRRLLIVGVIFISLSGCLIYVLNNQPTHKSAESVTVKAETVAASNAALSISANSSSIASAQLEDAALSPQLQSFKNAMGNEAAAREDVKSWFIAHGYNIQRISSDYDNYDEATLNKLGANGDIKALNRLEKIYDNKLTFEDSLKAREFRIKAAVYGSTEAIHSEAFTKQAEYGAAITEDDKRMARIEYMAWHKVTALRGDMASYYANEIVLKYNNTMIADEERQKISARANEIYADLQQQRNTLGLGDFDNSIPDVMKEYFSRFESQLR